MAKRASKGQKKAAGTSGPLCLSAKQKKLVTLIHSKGITGIPKAERELLELYGPVFLSACPKKNYLDCSGRPSRTLLDQHSRYSLPYTKEIKAVDLRKTIRWLHDFLARHGQSLNTQKSAEDQAFDLAGAELKQEMAQECVKQKRLANLKVELHIKEKLGEFVPVQPIEDFWSQASALVQKTINTFGGSGEVKEELVLDRMNDMLEDVDKLAEEIFGQDDSDTDTAA